MYGGGGYHDPFGGSAGFIPAPPGLQGFGPPPSPPAPDEFDPFTFLASEGASPPMPEPDLGGMDAEQRMLDVQRILGRVSPDQIARRRQMMGNSPALQRPGGGGRDPQMLMRALQMLQQQSRQGPPPMPQRQGPLASPPARSMFF